jgi:hypothetical protein
MKAAAEFVGSIEIEKTKEEVEEEAHHGLIWSCEALCDDDDQTAAAAAVPWRCFSLTAMLLPAAGPVAVALVLLLV